MPRPEEEAGQPAGAGVELSWLQAVQEHAVQKTEQLRTPPPPTSPASSAPEKVELPPQSSPQEPAPSGNPASQPIPIRQGVVPAPNAPADENATAAQPLAPRPDPNEPPPDWVVGILEPSVTPRPTQGQGYEPEELSHIMPWAHGEPEASAQATPDSQGLPPWLRDVTVQETLQSEGQAQAQAQQPVPAEDLALEGIEPFMPPPPEEESPTSTVQERPPEEVPAWLRSISGGPRNERGAASISGSAAQGSPTADASQPVSEAEVAPNPASVQAEPLAGRVPVRAPRPGAVDTLAALVQSGTTAPAPRPVSGLTATLVSQAEAARRRGLSKWLLPDGIIYILIAAVILAVLLVKPPFSTAPATTSTGITQFYNMLQKQPTGPTAKPVLVVYDWDATRSGEMLLLSQAVMRHLMSRHVPFVTISTAPQGPGFAQQVIDSVLADKSVNYGYTYGADYLVLGYLPGNEAALRSAVDDFTAVLPLDYEQGRRLDSFSILGNGKIRGAGDFGLVIELASDESELRNWIEQVGARTQVPIVAAVPQSLEPIARTYSNVPGTGLQALISGTTGAYAYSSRLIDSNKNLGNFDAGHLTDRLNAQSLAQLLLAVLIVVAVVSMATRRILRR